MDAEVIQLSKNHCLSRKLVNAADVLAVIERESGGVGIFYGAEALYRDNLAAAIRLTGLTRDEILAAVRIDYGPMKGQISKFRCEPGYWHWAKHLDAKFTPVERFLLSCSFGLGQKMTRWLVSGSKQDEWITIIRQFMGSKSTQIMYCAGDIENELRKDPAHRDLAYTRYNAGSGAKTVTEYGHDVLKRYEKFKRLLEGTHYTG